MLCYKIACILAPPKKRTSLSENLSAENFQRVVTAPTAAKATESAREAGRNRENVEFVRSKDARRRYYLPLENVERRVSRFVVVGKAAGAAVVEP